MTNETTTDGYERSELEPSKHPKRKRGTATFFDCESFLQYLDLQDEVPNLYAPSPGQVLAVFNDHVDVTPGYGDFRAILEMRRTPEWDAWKTIDRIYLDVDELTDHIEQWRHTIADPPTADLIALIRGFRATRNAVETKAGGKGELVLPEVITLAVEPFEDSDTKPVRASFRYRPQHQTWPFRVVLEQRPDKIERDEAEAVIETITAETGIAVMLGSPAT